MTTVKVWFLKLSLSNMNSSLLRSASFPNPAGFTVNYSTSISWIWTPLVNPNLLWMFSKNLLPSSIINLSRFPPTKIYRNLKTEMIRRPAVWRDKEWAGCLCCQATGFTLALNLSIVVLHSLYVQTTSCGNCCFLEWSDEFEIWINIYKLNYA